MSHPDDSLDLREVGAALRHGRAWVLGGAALGLLAAVAVLLFVPPRFEGTATLLLRDQQSPVPLAGAGELLPEGLGAMLGATSLFDTEMEILTSRAVMGEVADSLGLQARVLAPRGTPVTGLFSSTRFPEDFGGEREYRFVRAEGGYRVEGPGAEGIARPGVPYAIDGGSVTLAPDGLPDEIRIEVVSRQEAVRRIEKRLDSSQAGGDVAELIYHGDDPVTAAAVPNAVVARYMARRRTVDRGVNQHRHEFLAVHADSIAAALGDAERRLREYQEESGVLDPALSGEVETTQAMELRAELGRLDAESRSLGEIANGRLPSSRQLAAYPTMLQNGSMSGLLSRIIDLETRRTELLERRTPEDPDVIALARGIEQLEGEMVTLARSYVDGLERRRARVREELRSYETALAAMPARSERILGLQREVKRLSETLVVLQSQLVQTRLAAIGEGGDVRPLDTAVAPRRPAFPTPVLTLAGGVLGGLFFGVVGAVAAGRSRPRVREEWEAELATGAPASRLRASAPLLLPRPERSRTFVVLPVGDGACPRAVAERVAATTLLQGERVVLADLRPAGEVEPSGAHAPARPEGGQDLPARRSEDGVTVWYPNGDRAPLALQGAVRELEERFDRVVVAVPELDSPAAVALLSPERAVVLTGRRGLERAALQEAVRGLQRLGCVVAGIVLQDPPRGERRG